MTRARLLLALVLASFATLWWLAEPRADPAASIEQELQGEWVGGACEGNLVLAADGTFERRQFSPGGNHLKGTWDLRWPAFHPTIVLKCNTSDDQSYVGWISELHVVRLCDGDLQYRNAGHPDLIRLKRRQPDGIGVSARSSRSPGIGR